VSSSPRLLDPIERASEILFGLIMVLTFTGSISVAEGSAAETRTVLAAAIGCNLAWGIVDAAMYLMATFAERARNVATLRAIRHSASFDSAHRLIVDALPPVVSMVMTPVDVETLRVRLSRQPESVAAVSLSRTDFAGAAGVFLMVFLSTFPVVIPFLILHETSRALRASNAIAIVMLFLTGWSLGTHTGRRGWLTGLGMVSVGVVLVGITVALGG
jgi:VIT1/CCC1 family predicted Fe2+/Mn2+ transporter